MIRMNRDAAIPYPTICYPGWILQWSLGMEVHSFRLKVCSYSCFIISHFESCEKIMGTVIIKTAGNKNGNWRRMG